MNKTMQLFFAGALSLAVVSCNNESSSDGVKTDADTTKMGMQDAQDTAAKANEAMAAPQEKDADFVTEVAAANMAELAVQASAIAHSTNADVKSAAKMMQKDHKKLGDEAMAYAKKNNITLPGDADNSKKEDLVEMEKKTGADYDKAYADHMVDAHEKLIKKFEDNEGKRTDAELNTWITNTLPTLRHHLDMSKELQAKMK